MLGFCWASLVGCGPSHSPRLSSGGEMPTWNSSTRVLLVTPDEQGAVLAQRLLPVLSSHGATVMRDGTVRHIGSLTSEVTIGFDSITQARFPTSSLVQYIARPETDYILVATGVVPRRVKNLQIEVLDAKTGRLLATRAMNTRRFAGIHERIFERRLEEMLK